MTDIVIALFIAAVILVLMASVSSTMSSSFNERWPPIFDDGFLARCSPGTTRETALRVRRIISEQLGVPYDQIYPEQDFVNDLYC